MAKKRTQVDIVGDMLSAIQDKNGRIKPTHLMYKSNLSHTQLKSYLEELIEKEMVKEIKTKKNNTYFLITNKGDKFVQKLREMKQFEKSFGF
ncbi:hypothetical protein HOI26_02370 [Candidatus Woesearchaeota archaeon]|jgi:predicted transcriptional regulator|nr:hypothetical protein [Candidatus Woesearchaeota archaeon]MBT5739923.1 hypothetical protein [Candidatus Woesearchaeota archaeon]